jgi:hypothetical protein
MTPPPKDTDAIRELAVPALIARLPGRQSGQRGVGQPLRERCPRWHLSARPPRYLPFSPRLCLSFGPRLCLPFGPRLCLPFSPP